MRVETGQNVGSIARVMKNFDFNDLVIFNPIESIENIFSYEAQGYAMHGQEILLNAKIITIEDQKNHLNELKHFLKNFDLIIGTSAKGQRYTNIRRLAIHPNDLTLPVSKKPLNVAILFGRESRGLTNDDIALADILLRIPTSTEYSALNLSHACGIILYEIFKKINVITLGRGEKPILLADKEDRQFIYEIIKDLIKKLKIRPHKKENVFFAFKNILERALMSKKELSLITGLFTKVHSIIKDLHLYDE